MSLFLFGMTDVIYANVVASVKRHKVDVQRVDDQTNPAHNYPGRH